MSELSSHNNADAKKEQAAKSKQSCVVSTHNVIPYNREAKQKDIDKFVERRKAIIEKETDEVIKPEVAIMPEDDFGIEPPDEPVDEVKSGQPEPAEQKKPGRKKKDAE